MPRYRREELLTASEVARYVYCQRAWAYDRNLTRPRRSRRVIRFAVLLILLTAMIGFVMFVIGSNS